jgi:hypothetical protein
VKPSSSGMPPTKAVLCWMICGSTKDQQVTREKKKDASNFKESTACKIQIGSTDSCKIYPDGRPLSGPVEAFGRPGDPKPSSATKSRSRGILSVVEVIPASARHAHRSSTWPTRRCSNRNSNRINRAKKCASLESTISESHSRNGFPVETLQATSLRQTLWGRRIERASARRTAEAAVPTWFLYARFVYPTLLRGGVRVIIQAA